MGESGPSKDYPHHIPRGPASLVRCRCLAWFPWHSVPLLQGKRLPPAELPSVDYNTGNESCFPLTRAT